MRDTERQEGSVGQRGNDKPKDPDGASALGLGGEGGGATGSVSGV